MREFIGERIVRCTEESITKKDTTRLTQNKKCRHYLSNDIATLTTASPIAVSKFNEQSLTAEP